ncbi:FtsX-like permease family [Listeria grayi]|uniref:FtsX-like permease family n=1 Tax=Listeria grayi TaxID=1641 RepID=A0A378MAU1_LISGR|nr:ABC transporter permease [Listeria grayi]STY43487.1 FtsX-like permease family [Listeria grayi]
MTLFTLAKRNVSRNFSQYFLYMLSMVVSIAIYFTFVALKYSDSVAQKMTTSTKVSALMGGASVILLIFVAIFIFYSNSFFLKKRKKEVALYALLGLRKRQIGKMLFFENLLIGLIALIIGTALGFLFSKGFAMLLLIFIHSSETVSFTFSLTAVLQTALVFFLLFFITSLQGYRLIYRFKLIDLFHAEGKGESMPKPSLWLALIAILSIAAGYYLALENILTSKWWELFGMLTTPLLILVLVIAGTFLLFHSLVGYFFIYMKKHRLYCGKICDSSRSPNWPTVSAPMQGSLQ